MNDRDFARAHDAYLEPPDEEDEDDIPDEMDLADIRKQEQRDWEDWQAETYRRKGED